MTCCSSPCLPHFQEGFICIWYTLPSSIKSVEIWTGNLKPRLHWICYKLGTRSSAVSWGIMVQTGRPRFVSRWAHWISQLIQSFQLHYGPGTDSASNRNEYQESSCGGKGWPLPPSVSRLSRAVVLNLHETAAQ
jgi:hypothetical protein